MQSHVCGISNTNIEIISGHCWLCFGSWHKTDKDTPSHWAL